MKKRLLIVMMITMMTGAALVGCKSAENKSTALPEENVEQAQVEEGGNALDEGELSPEDAQINKLIEEENQIMAKHDELWGRILDSADKDEATQQLENGDYMGFLKSTVAKVESSLSEDEKMIVQEDMKKIEEIENKIAAIEKK